MRSFLWHYWFPEERFSFHFLPFHREVRLQGQLQKSTFGAAGDYLACRHFCRANAQGQGFKLRPSGWCIVSLYSLQYKAFFQWVKENQYEQTFKQSFSSSLPPHCLAWLEMSVIFHSPLSQRDTLHVCLLLSWAINNGHGWLITNINWPPPGVCMQSGRLMLDLTRVSWC